jgi:quinol monooxygenase YgiN
VIRLLVRYRVHPEAAGKVREAIATFVDAVRANEPDTIYGALAAEDGVSFVHAMAFPDEGAEERHRAAPYTRAFVDALYPACEARPEFTRLEVVRSTRKGGGFLGGG